MNASAPGRSTLSSVPKAAWLCALVALLNGVVWSLIVPLFQVPDEEAHVGYVQYLAETGRPPSGTNNETGLSAEERALMRATYWRVVIFHPESRPPVTKAENRRLEKALDETADRESEGGYTRASANPPLYYAVAAAAYRASPSTPLHDRIHVIRVLSALLGAITVLLIFLFLRELLPGTPWAAAVGALAVAFQPMFGFISGGVNSDNLLYTAAASIFLGFAVCFRRGLTVPRGIWIGASGAVAVLTKIPALGLLPGIALGLLLLIGAASPAERREAIRAALAAGVTILLPVLGYLLLNSLFWDRGLYLGETSGKDVPGSQVSLPSTGDVQPTLGGFLSYTWQFYLPRLSFMGDWFQTNPLRGVWFDGFVGNFGWLDYGFPRWVYDLALVIYGTVVALLARELIGLRHRLRARSRELATYGALALGVLLLVHAASYIGQLDNPGGFEQARYLFPLLALYGAIVAVAARGAGRRFGPAVGFVLVSLAIAHSIVAMLLTLTRYYG
jgi:4-amino-4-deoxy-L-arabinose transferase-like glycosyltransferase